MEVTPIDLCAVQQRHWTGGECCPGQGAGTADAVGDFGTREFVLICCCVIDSFLSIHDAESLPLYRMVLKLACVLL